MEQSQLIKCGNKIFGLYQNNDDFLVTITEKKDNGVRIKHSYKEWNAMPSVDRKVLSDAWKANRINLVQIHRFINPNVKK